MQASRILCAHMFNFIFDVFQEFFQSGPSHKGQGNDGKSFLTIEWTNQHGCGGSEDKDPHKLNCNLVLQYMCEPDVGSPEKFNIRNGK